ncbi:PREDICTED: band 7 protein AAEL010189-like, partial [Atta colombica]|uniref:band 7 protein AAEL010189-like n=1 Tax=Atta colombica TaxID=520822 RepID=UPI00084C8CE5
MATMSNSNGSTMQINTRPDDIRKRIIGSDDSAQGDATTCGNILVILSWIVVILTMPFSLFVCFKVVQEYERAVIFRLGRLLSGGAKGPGIFFILPCVDNYARVDLRTRTYDVPPQEVIIRNSYYNNRPPQQFDVGSITPTIDANFRNDCPGLSEISTCIDTDNELLENSVYVDTVKRSE